MRSLWIRPVYRILTAIEVISKTPQVLSFITCAAMIVKKNPKLVANSNLDIC